MLWLFQGTKREPIVEEVVKRGRGAGKKRKSPDNEAAITENGNATKTGAKTAGKDGGSKQQKTGDSQPKQQAPGREGLVSLFSKK